jgi:hypothetical protein
MRIIVIEVDGDEAVLRQALADATGRFAPVAELPAAPKQLPAADVPAVAAPRRQPKPIEPKAEDAEPAKRRGGRPYVIDQRPGQRYDRNGAAKVVGISGGALYQRLRKGNGVAAVGQYTVRLDDDSEVAGSRTLNPHLVGRAADRKTEF